MLSRQKKTFGWVGRGFLALLQPRFKGVINYIYPPFFSASVYPSSFPVFLFSSISSFKEPLVVPQALPRYQGFRDQ